MMVAFLTAIAHNWWVQELWWLVVVRVMMVVVSNKKKKYGTGGMSSKIVWQNVAWFPASWKTFCDVHVPQCGTAELNGMSTFENISVVASVQLTVDETSRNAEQEI
jgi:hypothetical protein